MAYKDIEDYKKYRKNNKEKYSGYEKKYKQNNKEKINEYRREYRKTHPLTEQQKVRKRYFIKRHTKFNINGKISNNLRVRIRLSLKGKTKSKHTLELLGCSIDFLKQWLQDKFTESMTWENYGRGKGKWGIDHKTPCSKFDLTDPEQQKQCFHYSNLQPMWHVDNSRKNNKI